MEFAGLGIEHISSGLLYSGLRGRCRFRFRFRSILLVRCCRLVIFAVCKGYRLSIRSTVNVAELIGAEDLDIFCFEFCQGLCMRVTVAVILTALDHRIVRIYCIQESLRCGCAGAMMTNFENRGVQIQAGTKNHIFSGFFCIARE